MTDVRVVVKIGTSSVTDDHGTIDDDAIVKLASEVAALRADGHEVVVVSSGAVAAGVAALGLTERPTDVATLQALSAAGQPRLMRSWDAALAAHGLVPAQALLVPHDFVDRRQYLHARRTLTRLLQLGTIPIVNENDAIARDEARYGDNDRLAALVAHNIGAAVVVLLTDLDGLFTADPRVHAGARLVTRVPLDDPMLAISAGRGGSGRGSGGMASKLEAARIASWSGVRTVIANAAQSGVLAAAVAGEPVGTTFEAHRRKLGARKLWIAFANARRRLRDRRRRCPTGARRAPDEPAPGRRGVRRRSLRLGRHGRHRRQRRRALRPRHGVRRSSPAPSSRRSPHVRAPAGHGPRGHPPRRSGDAAGMMASLRSACLAGPGGPRPPAVRSTWPSVPAALGGLGQAGGASCTCSTGCGSGAVAPPRPSSARSSLRRLWASTLAVACSTSSTRDCTDVSVSSAVALALA